MRAITLLALFALFIFTTSCVNDDEDLKTKQNVSEQSITKDEIKEGDI